MGVLDIKSNTSLLSKIFSKSQSELSQNGFRMFIEAAGSDEDVARITRAHIDLAQAYPQHVSSLLVYPEHKGAFFAVRTTPTFSLAAVHKAIERAFNPPPPQPQPKMHFGKRAVKFMKAMQRQNPAPTAS